ncbi:MAG TPA: TraR/DksA C4-type zinc finger protein [Noviherbaspirillum sp.]|nr:TraR/DksA C4-type zinc finger protein [Noviherbaspirillum sp.]
MSAVNNEKNLLTLQERRAEILNDLRRRLHAEGENEQLALVNHLEETGDWAEASTENLQDIALLQHEIDSLRRIDGALQRLKDGQFGVCQQCGEAIPQQRLEAQPEAVACLKCQTELEQRVARRA